MADVPAWRRRVPHLRSMRFRALLVVLAVVALPLALAALAGVEERTVAARLVEQVKEGVVEAAAAPRIETLDQIASEHSIRIRMLAMNTGPMADLDHIGDKLTIGALAAYLFFGDDGAPSARAFDKSIGLLGEREEIRRAFDEQGPVVLCRTSPGSKLLLCSAALRSHQWGGDRIFYAQAASRRPVRALYDLRYEMAKLVALMLPVGLLLAWWLGARTVRPIEQLREQVLASAARALPGPVDLARSDEIGDLAAAFNGLLATLDARRREHEAFVADLVHEFKNPVAAIRASAEQLQDASDERTRRLAKALDDSGARLDALVTQFLELARAEAGMPSESRGEVDVAALARGVVDAAKDDPRWSGVRFAVRAEGAAIVSGVAPRLESAVRNLVENAASFALPDGAVDVEVTSDATRVRLAVRDSGPGIAEADLDRVFDRFFTTRGRAHGTGLGLALVKAVVLAHGGEARAESEPGKGAVFRVELPRGH